MVRRVNNMNELESALKSVMLGMVDKMADTVYKTLNYFLYAYYQSYEPEFYSRTYEFLRSAVKTKMIRGKAVAQVYIDYDSLDDYQIPGYQVVLSAEKSLHGWQNLGNNTPHVWSDTMEKCIDSGLLLKEAVSYLNSKGITVHT